MECFQHWAGSSARTAFRIIKDTSWNVYGTEADNWNMESGPWLSLLLLLVRKQRFLLCFVEKEVLDCVLSSRLYESFCYTPIFCLRFTEGLTSLRWDGTLSILPSNLEKFSFVWSNFASRSAFCCTICPILVTLVAGWCKSSSEIFCSAGSFSSAGSNWVRLHSVPFILPLGG